MEALAALSLLGSFLFAALPAFTTAQSQITFPSGNVTGLRGTWSSGTGNVTTGGDFCNPVNFTFNPPQLPGISYSFTDDGWFEEAQFRFIANGSDPRCPQVILIWQHGNYDIHPNNSITLTPISADGRIEIQSPCTAQTSQMYFYSQWELYNGWTIAIDNSHPTYVLQLYGWDGSMMPRLYKVYDPPNMLPLAQLTTNETVQEQSSINANDVNGQMSNQGSTPDSSTQNQGVVSG